MTADEGRPGYPAPVFEFYGRLVWPLGEAGDEGVMVEGHGPRAFAALNAYQRTECGVGWRRDPHLQDRYRPGRRPKLALTNRWVTFRETCGCTDAQHAEHAAAAVARGGCPCTFPGLPPCEPDQFEWTYRHATPATPGALPVTEVIW